MSTYWIGDTHFGHHNIIRYCNRPFKNVNEMDQAMITNWNSVVKNGDEVHHVGDFCYGRGTDVAYARNIVSQLAGRIHLYLGNHDKLALQIKNQFASIQHYNEIEVEGQRMVIFHYGMRTWHHDLKGVWHLYGHSHGHLPPMGKSVDVGVDTWNFTPISFSQLKEFMDKRTVSTDHPRLANYDPIASAKDREHNENIR